MSLYTSGTRSAANLVLRLIICFTVCAICFTVMGMVNVAKDAFASHRNFAYMSANEFKNGDIVFGTVTETLGCAARSESGGKSSTTSYYYVVPLYSNADDPFPDRIIMLETANRSQYRQLDSLFDATIERYMGNSTESSRVYIDHAEVRTMSNDEYDACRSYVENFVDALYAGADGNTLSYAKQAYTDAIVRYTVQYTASSAGSTILFIGLTMLGILIVGTLVYIAVSKRSSSQQSMYIGANDPNLNAPTGLNNASARYDSPAVNQARPMQQPNLSRSQPAGNLRADYSMSERPMPPIEGVADPPRIIRYDPQTGRPVYAAPGTYVPKAPEAPEPPAEMEVIDLKNTDLVDTSNGGIDKTEGEVQTQTTRDNTVMPAIDLKDHSFADLSNGGVDADAWDGRANIAQMPMNGDIPVINPERYTSSAFYGSEADMLPETEKPAEPEPTDTSAPEDILVQPTDPSHRNMYSQILGGNEMNAIDLKTETEKDYSNGGTDNVAVEPKPSFPETPAFPSVEEKPIFPAAEEKPIFPAAEEKPIFTTPEEKPAFPTVEEKKPEFPETKPEEASYNIFKTDSSSYNIFKDPKLSDNHMGFPIEDRGNSSLDTSFPTADKKDFKT